MYHKGSILRIDLTTKEIRVESLNRQWAEMYLGGKGLGIKYLYKEIPAGMDPLSPDNKFILMTGMFAGTVVPCSGKLSVITKSPATGTVLDCSIGGHFAGELKYAGFDALIIEGKASEPVSIKIEDDRVEIIATRELWGLGAQETELVLKRKIDQDVKVLAIGPAGEKLITMACITSEFYRQAGRGGVGAVMGSKNLKAIAVKGSGSVTVPDIQGFMKKIKEIMDQDTLTDTNLWAASEGTPFLVQFCNETGILPTRNFTQGSYEDYVKIDGEAVKAAKIGRKGCLSCALGCGIYTKLGDTKLEGPEYETLALAGSNCGINDLEAIAEFNQLCDDLGLDTISMGNTTAFAMELTERGIKDFGLKFGDVEAYLQVPVLVAARSGIGSELCWGVKGLAQKYGGAEFAMHVKGLEMPGYNPRGAWGMGLAYATADRGACHMRGWPVGDELASEAGPFSIGGKAQLVVQLQNYNAARYSAGLCDFWALSLGTLAAIISAAGKPMTAMDLEQIGERVINLARLFNSREGFHKKDDYLPERIYGEALKTGTAAGKVIPKVEFEKMLAEYYHLRGWDKEGRPLPEKLLELGIE